MAGDVLLIVNCALDSSYSNRHVLHRMYRDRFDEIVFTVSATCPIDPEFRTISQRWAPPTSPKCICSNAELGDHGALRHSFHPRLLAAATTAAEYDYIMFTEDDCLIAPDWNIRSVRQRCEGWDAIAAPIRPCSRDDPTWVWTRHGSGYPAFDAIADRLDHRMLLAHWQQYDGSKLAASSEPTMFFGFCDWFVVSRRALGGLFRDLGFLQNVWHEAAIPTALLHNSPRIDVSSGVPLWGRDRDRPLRELMNLLARHDFVHAVKLSRYSRAEILSAYRSIMTGD